MTKTVTVSARFTTEHLAYLYTTLKEIGYEPTTLTELSRFSMVALINNVNPTIIHDPPDPEALSTVNTMLSKGKEPAINALSKAPSSINLNSLHKEPNETIDPTIAQKLPLLDREIATKIIAAINAGVSIISQLNNSNPTIARITYNICKQLTQDSFSPEEQATIVEIATKYAHKT